MIYANTNIRSPQTYLVVHHSDTEEQNKIFKTYGLHAEENFMDHYRGERHRKVQLYLTLAPCGAQEKNCAKQLTDFAEAYNFELNIKVAALHQNNEEDLRYLMTSEYCTVEAFRKKDYRDLAKHLGFEMSGDWVPLQATIERDEQTRQTLRRIQNNVN